jgi:hypothetical protein
MTRAAVAIAFLLTLATSAVAGLRVVEDEVIFTLRAPGAGDVYIVGDFNNWNPTVEPMEREDDVFEISLFLVPGTYRYKFVVDGRWIVDPENPGDPEKGSYFTIEERPGGYALSTDEPEPERVVASVSPSLRYIGEFRYDDDDFDDRQYIDLYLDVERSHLRGCANLQSARDTWKASPPSTDIDIAGLFVEASAGALTLRGFESDSVWTSRGPVTLVGNDGVFDYNAGFDRHGASIELEPSETIVVRAMYTDRLGGNPPSAPLALGDSAGYAFAGDVEGSDQAAVEVAIDASDFAAGYVSRFDRGLNPGALALADTVLPTREYREVSLYWVRLKSLYGFDVAAAYGRGSSQARRMDTHGKQTIIESDRFTATLGRALLGLSWDVSWDRTTFDYDAAISAGASATVDRWNAGAAWSSTRWTAAVRARLTDQDYGDAPPELHVDSPVGNLWIGGRDEFGVADIAALGHDRYTTVTAALAWTWGEDAPLEVRARAEAGASGKGALEAVELLVARSGVEVGYREYYASLDGRMARYDRADWGASDTYTSGWLEAGYRRGPFGLNIGYGFDPVVYDPVSNDYGDIGRARFLRAAIAPGIRRDDAAVTGERLLALERMLEATNEVKLECIIHY